MQCSCKKFRNFVTKCMNVQITVNLTLHSHHFSVSMLVVKVLENSFIESLSALQISVNTRHRYKTEPFNFYFISLPMKNDQTLFSLKYSIGLL